MSGVLGCAFVLFDLDVFFTAKLAREYFNWPAPKVVYGITLEDIKKELAQGNLVITPMAGRILQNPYYRRPGPIYHMVVVRGYTEKEIITNDPGTRRGEGFRYLNDNFFNSLHDWPFEFGKKIPKEEAARGILDGQKAMIVFEK